MKNAWYLCATLLAVAVLAGLSGISPTSAVIANIAPVWDFPTSDFSAGESAIILDLDRAFFDPDADKMSYDATATQGVHAQVNESTLTITAQASGDVIISAFDGQKITTHRIRITKI